jgi:hypothetical protein
VLGAWNFLVLFIAHFSHGKYLVDHLVLLGLVGTLHGCGKARPQVVFHQQLVGRFKKPDDSQVLLHDIDAINVLLGHFNDFVQMAAGLLEIDKRFFFLCVHVFIII